jgi:hypothetical protein
MRRRTWRTLIFLPLFFLTSTGAFASERIRFAPGNRSGSVSGSVSNYDVASYLFKAKAGQTASIKLTSANRFLYFSLEDPSTSNPLEADPKPDTVTDWKGTLPKDGDYEIKVYLMRAEARRGKTASFTLTLSLP